MTAPPSIDLSGWLSEQLGETSPDLLRSMITTPRVSTSFSIRCVDTASR